MERSSLGTVAKDRLILDMGSSNCSNSPLNRIRCKRNTRNATNAVSKITKFFFAKRVCKNIGKIVVASNINRFHLPGSNKVTQELFAQRDVFHFE